MGVSMQDYYEPIQTSNLEELITNLERMFV